MVHYGVAFFVCSLKSDKGQLKIGMRALSWREKILTTKFDIYIYIYIYALTIATPRPKQPCLKAVPLVAIAGLNVAPCSTQKAPALEPPQLPL